MEWTGLKGSSNTSPMRGIRTSLLCGRGAERAASRVPSGERSTAQAPCGDGLRKVLRGRPVLASHTMTTESSPLSAVTITALSELTHVAVMWFCIQVKETEVVVVVVMAVHLAL